MIRKKIDNIFSKEKEETEIIPNLKIPIIADTREKRSLVIAHLVNKKANVKIDHLEIADYLVGEYGIERKTFSDFLGSMINKRLMEQLKEIKKYPKCFLILENFYYNYSDFNIHENAIKGMIISVMADFNVPIIYTENEEDTAKFLILLARKQEKEKREIGIRPEKTAKKLSEQKQFILEGFPGIGPTLSKKLLQEFPNLKEIFNASKEELRQIENFTEDKIDRFRELLEK
jgi:Fanconi anemia group M protein